ncbi:YveK family protein [Listeria booriae]|uniref:YveK family protein n=1 Tax=Listeria booriae TaxID=1552123 RepID=UPI001627B0B7|nr:Wzz/FepE/Etk N-terminal domain-containing protein [Listeria booriae]MBC2173358.1 capsular biosynthesis protein [Listeria booriae]
MNERIDTKKVILTIKRNMGWLILIVFLFISSMFVYLNYIATPMYQKSTQILVNQSDKSQSNGIEAQTVQADLQLVNTYSGIISSPRILNQVQKELDDAYTFNELADMVKVKNTTNSQIIEIDVINANPRTAAKIANITAKTFSKEAPKIMKVDNVTTLSEAQVFDKEVPAKPNKLLMMGLAFFLGIVVAFAFIIIRIMIDRTFNSTEEIEDFLDVHILGEVSLFPSIDPLQNERMENKL